MRKINYPLDKFELASFEDDFYNCLNKTNENEINIHFAKIPYATGILTLKIFVKLNFEELVSLEPALIAHSKSKSYKKNIKGKITTRNRFNDLFDYTCNQPNIAEFFMRQKTFDLKTCHYCGIDYINAFKDIEDYENGVDFINRADIHDLTIIHGIGKIIAKQIIAGRKPNEYEKVDDIGLTKSIRDQIKSFNFKKGHNHFTIDHLLPQKTHKFFSLCLYNFVPSCYSCNSKFKKGIDLKVNSELQHISPTSVHYSFTEDFKFKLFYSKRFEDIKSESDFLLKKEIVRNVDQIESYFAMFKLSGRYVFHKDQVLTLIKNKIKYPESKIKELSKTTGLPLSEIREIVFGKELFDDSLSNQPFIKFKRDIAKNIEIDGVI